MKFEARIVRLEKCYPKPFKVIVWDKKGVTGRAEPPTPEEAANADLVCEIRFIETPPQVAE